MTARVTRCLTWGEYRNAGAAPIVQDGRRVGIVHFGAFVTICGKLDDDPENPNYYDTSKPRPVGVCRACWKQYRTEMQRLETRP